MTIIVFDKFKSTHRFEVTPESHWGSETPESVKDDFKPGPNESISALYWNGRSDKMVCAWKDYPRDRSLWGSPEERERLSFIVGINQR